MTWSSRIQPSTRTRVSFELAAKRLGADVVNLEVQLSSRVKVFVKLTLPLLLPYIVSALRIAYGVAWKIALVSELFGTGTGLGYLMGEAQQSAKPALLYACCFAIVLIFFAGEKLVLDPLSRRVRR